VSDQIPAPREVIVHSLETNYALDRYRDELIGDGHAPRRVLANIRDMAEKRIRNPQWARLYTDLMGWTGMREQVIAALVRELGVTLEQAQDAVGTVLSIPDDVHEVARINREFLAWYDGPNGPGREHAAMLKAAKNGNGNGNGVHR